MRVYREHSTPSNDATINNDLNMKILLSNFVVVVIEWRIFNLQTLLESFPIDKFLLLIYLLTIRMFKLLIISRLIDKLFMLHLMRFCVTHELFRYIAHKLLLIFHILFALHVRRRHNHPSLSFHNLKEHRIARWSLKVCNECINVSRSHIMIHCLQVSVNVKLI